MLKRSGFAALAVALVMAGAAWGGHVAPATQASEPQVVSSAPSIAHALASLFEAGDLFRAALVTGVLSTEAAKGSDAPFDARVHALRPHPGQRG